MDGRSFTMEGRNFLPALDKVDQPRLWRTAFYFLSAGFMVTGSGFESFGELEPRPRCDHNFVADICGIVGVRARATDGG